jgi:hypothetical protein
MRNRSLRVAVQALALLLFAGASMAQDQGTDNAHEFHWTGKLPAEQVLVIKNVNGDITANGSSSGEIEVTAEKTGPDADQVKVHVMKINDGLVICAVAPGWFGGDDCESRSHFTGNHDRTKVNFTVRLPQNLRFTAESVNGSINADGMGRYVEGSSVNGGVHIDTRSWASAKSVNGSIEARIGRAEWPGELDFRTVNGSVKLELPSNASTDVNFASVNGHLESDFPLTMQGSIGRHSIHGAIGSGGRELNVHTVNGSVELHKAAI